MSGGVLGVITNHTSQFSILSSQFSILNLLGVAGATGEGGFCLIRVRRVSPETVSSL